MATFNAVDLSKLPAPQVIEDLSFEDILSAMKSDLASRDSSLQSVLEYESEPLTKLLQVCAYRELILRQRINDAAKSVMLAYATGSNLDNLAALFGVTRQLVDEGDSTAIPPIAPSYESDDRLRQRVQLSMEGNSTAGPSGSYIFWGLSASGDVKDISVDSPTPGTVVVTILSTSGNGNADNLFLYTDSSNAIHRLEKIHRTELRQLGQVIPYKDDVTLFIVQNDQSIPTLQWEGQFLNTYTSDTNIADINARLIDISAYFFITDDGENTLLCIKKVNSIDTLYDAQNNIVYEGLIQLNTVDGQTVWQNGTLIEEYSGEISKTATIINKDDQIFWDETQLIAFTLFSDPENFEIRSIETGKTSADIEVNYTILQDIITANNTTQKTIVTEKKHWLNGQLTSVNPNDDISLPSASSLLLIVYEQLNDDDVRPLTDHVIVQSAEIIEYKIEAELTLFDDPDSEVARKESKSKVETFTQEKHKLGYDITESGLHAALHQPGVQNVDLTIHIIPRPPFETLPKNSNGYIDVAIFNEWNYRQVNKIPPEQLLTEVEKKKLTGSPNIIIYPNQAAYIDPTNIIVEYVGRDE